MTSGQYSYIIEETSEALPLYRKGLVNNMKKMQLGTTPLQVSPIALGCMRIGAKSQKEIQALVEKALELGINYMDHADIYSWGKNSEEMFGELLKEKPSLREQMYIQTKCGICGGYYDSSKEHILESVDNSLRKMNLDKIDVLLIHRPDALMEPEEVAEAFHILKDSGKVDYFGVSNMNPMQIQLIEKYTGMKMVADQVQFNVVHSGMVDEGIYVNMKDDGAIMRTGNLIEYAMLHEMTLQAWSVLMASWADGSYIDHPKYASVNEKLQELADVYGVSKNAIALAWILRHPCKIQAIAGTTSVQHLEELCKGAEIQLTRKQWYELYLSNGKQLP